MSCIFFCFVVVIVFAALPSTNSTEYSLKEKTHLSSVVDHTRCLLLFYSSSVWIYMHIYLILLIYIYLLLLTASLSLIFFLFFSLLIDMVQNDYFYSNLYFVWWERKRGGLISFFRHNRSSSFSSTVHYRWKGHHMIVPKHLI